MINKSYIKEFNIQHYFNAMRLKKEMFFSLGDKVEVQYFDISDDEVSKRKFSGICISKKNLGSNNFSFTLRFNYKKDIIYQQFFFYSPLIRSIKVSDSSYKKSRFYKVKV